MIRYALIFLLFSAPAHAQSVFTSLPTAQAHCPQDTIVWLNTVRHVYRLPDQKGYAHAKNSSFACRKEADAAGDRLKKFKSPQSAGPATGTVE